MAEEFVPYQVKSATVDPNTGDVLVTGGCPSGYTPIDADVGQLGATPASVFGGTQYYLRCIRNDIYAHPELSKDEPVYTPPARESAGGWFDWLKGLLAGAGTTTLIVAGAAAYFLLRGSGGVTIVQGKNPRRRR